MRADRLLAILLWLQSGRRVTAPELAARLEVSVRTIYRDVDALSAAGVPVYAERGGGGGIRLLEGYRADLAALDPTDAGVMFLLGLPGLFAALGLGPDMSRVQERLLAAMPPSWRPEATARSARVHIDPVGWFRPSDELEVLPTLARALWEDRRLEIEYASPDGEARRRVHPLGLVLKEGVWYLVADRAHVRRVYRVSRMLSATMLEEASRRPPDFDLVRFWQDWSSDFERSVPSMDVSLRVAPEGADDLLTVLGEQSRAQLSSAPVDDDGWRRIEVDFPSYEQARLRLLGLGNRVEVLAPEGLRREMARAAKEAADLYA